MATTATKKEDKVLNIDERILEVQKSARSLAKDAENKGFNYSYVSGSKLLGVLRPVMDSVGLLLTPAIMPETIEKTDRSIFFFLRWVWTCAETGETREDLWPAFGCNISLDKAIGGAYTYAERYYLLKKFHIGTDEDDVDSMAKIPGPAPQQTVETKSAPAPATRAPKKKVKITLENIQAGIKNGKSQSLIDELAAGYDSLDDIFDDEVVRSIRERFDWADDAFEALEEEARRAGFRRDLEKEDEARSDV